ncbi:hypothetical protein P8452_54967 [Trifolium repens]|nr:hypothetical protein P8452_54967 [Trifolium repens]
MCRESILKLISKIENTANPKQSHSSFRFVPIQFPIHSGHYTERVAAAVVKTIVEVVQLCHKLGTELNHKPEF